MFKEIAVSIKPISDNNRGMLRGVVDYVATQPDLRVFKIGAVPYVPLAKLRGWCGAGAVATAETASEQRQLADLKVPRVSVSLHQKPLLRLPVVHSDNHAIGRMAARHLRELGLARFAFVGHLAWRHNAARLNGFREELNRHGVDCDVIEIAFQARKLSTMGTFEPNRKSLARQLTRLVYPLGLFATHDEFAHDVVEMVRDAGLRVPYDAAVVGVNDNRLICETSDPPLSSIAQSAHQIGFAAAKLLHEIILGRKSPQQPLLIPPGKLVTRRSSNYSAVQDEVVLRALDYIHVRCGEPITATDVVAHTGVSRRTLDKRFVSAIGHPAAEEIRLARIKKARELLVSTSMQVMMVGLSCGYDSPSGFVRAFREATGITPLDYRKQMGTKSDSY